ncbi:MAG: OmpA family protein [Flavihumibacter sp.]
MTGIGEDGSADYWNSPVKTYLVRRANGDDVYIQVSGNTAGGTVQVLQKEAFKQTITMLKADDIEKELSSKGKAVLHINFDTDKATLKPDGLDAVKEIIKVLQADNSLKIAINGYTDNVGDAAHNQQLSEARAATVKNEISKAGIAGDRLTAKGFGQSDPIADNNTEEGRMQNRRVELVKGK